MSRDAPAFPVVDVECHAGYRGEETPRRFRLPGDRRSIFRLSPLAGPNHRYSGCETRRAIFISCVTMLPQIAGS